MDQKPFSPYSVSVSRASSYMSWVGTRAQTSLTRTSFDVKTSLKRTAPKVKPLWLSAQRQAWSDLRARGGRGCLWVLAVLWACGLTTGFALLCVWSRIESSGSARANSGSACLPDDSFSLRPDLYRYWSNSGFFQITLGTGELSFTQAKAIDVIWDIVVGRGGQGLLAYLSWQTFVRYVTTSMEVQPVTFNTYRTVFLQNESLVLGIPRIIRDFCRRRSLHSRFAMVFIVLTMVLILIFPTLGGSMTGYSGNVNAFVKDYGGNYVPFKEFDIVVYTIHDGSRINQTDDFHATIYRGSEADPSLLDIMDWYWYSSYSSYYSSCDNRYPESQADCISRTMISNISTYIGLYGTEPQTNVQSTFGNFTLPAPTLNVTVHDTPPRLNRTKGDDNLRYNSGYTGKTAMFLSGNETYSQNYVETSAQCQAQTNYQWGFSFIQLALMLMLLLLWTSGILTMYATSKLTRLRRGNRTQIAGEYRAVFELADAMHSQLLSLENEDSICSGGDARRNLSEGELRERIETQLRGGEISYGEGDAGLPRKGKAGAVEDGLLSSGTTESEKDGGKEEGGAEWTVKAWVRRELWWLLALALALVVEGVVIAKLVQWGMSVSAGVWMFPALPLAVLFAMYVGLTHASRGMVLFWAVLVVCVMPSVVLGSVLGAFSYNRAYR